MCEDNLKAEQTASFLRRDMKMKMIVSDEMLTTQSTMKCQQHLFKRKTLLGIHSFALNVILATLKLNQMRENAVFSQIHK